MNQVGRTVIYRTFHPKTKGYTFFSDLHGTFSKIDYTLRYKASRKRYKKIEVTPFVLLDHHGLKIDINNNRKLKNS